MSWSNGSSNGFQAFQHSRSGLKADRLIAESFLDFIAEAEGLMGGRDCERCGKELPPGSLAYVIRLEVYADFDGHLREMEGEEDLERAMREVVEEVRDQDADELLREVYYKEAHFLCKGCRDRYLANPLNLPLPEGL